MELEFARVDMSLARLLTRQNQLDEATALLNGAAQRFEALVNRFPEQGSYREALAQAYQSQGELFGARASRSHAPTMLQAVAASQKSLEMFQSSGPRTDDAWRASLSAKYFALGYSLQQTAQLGGDRSFYRRALDAHLGGLAVVRTLFDARFRTAQPALSRCSDVGGISAMVLLPRPGPCSARGSRSSRYPGTPCRRGTSES